AMFRRDRSAPAAVRHILDIVQHMPFRLYCGTCGRRCGSNETKSTENAGAAPWRCGHLRCASAAQHSTARRGFQQCLADRPSADVSAGRNPQVQKPAGRQTPHNANAAAHLTAVELLLTAGIADRDNRPAYSKSVACRALGG